MFISDDSNRPPTQTDSHLTLNSYATNGLAIPQTVTFPTELGLGDDRLIEGGKEGKGEKWEKKGKKGKEGKKGK